MVRNAILSSAMGELPPAECQAELWVSSDAGCEPRAGGTAENDPGPGMELRTAAKKLGAAVHAVLALRRLPARELTVVQAR